MSELKNKKIDVKKIADINGGERLIEIVECPICNGKGSFGGIKCNVCNGAGQYETVKPTFRN